MQAISRYKLSPGTICPALPACGRTKAPATKHEKTRAILDLRGFFVGGDGGIRTHVPLRTTAFRVFYSQHTLADFEKKCPILRENALVRKKMIFSPLRLFPTVRNARELSERTNRTAIKHNNRKSP